MCSPVAQEEYLITCTFISLLYPLCVIKIASYRVTYNLHISSLLHQHIIIIFCIMKLHYYRPITLLPWTANV